MIPGQFEYVRPGSLDEALRILRDREGEAKVLSGGYSLLPLLKLRLAQPSLLVDIQAIDGLDGISESDGWLQIGARATHRQIHTDPIINDHHPMLVDVAGGIGDPQVRNWGTIGGSVAHADPSSDWPAVLLAARATLVCRSRAGDPHQFRVGANVAAAGDAVRERTLPARSFFVDTFATALDPSEVLTEIRIPLAAARTGGAYVKLERRAGDFATVGVAAILTLGADGRVTAAGVGLTAVAEAPFAASDAEAVLGGATPTEDTFRAAGAAAAEQARPVSDSHGPADYKTAMVREITVRALRLAAARAQGV